MQIISAGDEITGAGCSNGMGSLSLFGYSGGRGDCGACWIGCFRVFRFLIVKNTHTAINAIPMRMTASETGFSPIPPVSAVAKMMGAEAIDAVLDVLEFETASAN